MIQFFLTFQKPTPTNKMLKKVTMKYFFSVVHNRLLCPELASRMTGIKSCNSFPFFDVKQ